MATESPAHPAPEDLAALLDRWVGDGLLTAEQAAEILAHEVRVEQPPEASAPRHRLVLEALAYLGGVLTAVAAGLLVELVWPDLSDAVRLAVPLSAAVLLMSAGLVVPVGTPERSRLRSAVLLVGTLCWLASLAVLGAVVLDLAGPDTLLIVGLGGAAVGLRLYLHEQVPAQQVGLLLPLALTAAALGARAPGDEPTWPGVGVWLVAVGWLVLTARAQLRPAGPAGLLGAVALVVGAMLTQGSLGGQGLALGTVGFL
jgi:hypothetical protein